MQRVLAPALAYFAIVFAVAFCLGTLRVLVIAPRLGEIGAVALEIPLMLGLSWLVAGWVLQRWPLPAVGARLGMGALAFALLMATEATLSVTLFGRPMTEFLHAQMTPAGLLGLCGQVGFALIPALRR